LGDPLEFEIQNRVFLQRVDTEHDDRVGPRQPFEIGRRLAGGQLGGSGVWGDAGLVDVGGLPDAPGQFLDEIRLLVGQSGAGHDREGAGTVGGQHGGEPVADDRVGFIPSRLDQAVVAPDQRPDQPVGRVDGAESEPAAAAQVAAIVDRRGRV